MRVLHNSNFMPMNKYYEHMGTLRPKTYLNSAATFFTMQTAIVPYSGLSIEILCILVAQGAAKLL